MEYTARPNAGRIHERVEFTSRTLTIDRTSREVSFNGERIELTATEFDILEFLERNPHQVVTYAEVITAIWGDAHYFERHALEVQVSRLRTELGESGTNPYFIETVRGYGYRFQKESNTGHLATIHYGAEMDIISAWVSTESESFPPRSRAHERLEDWLARWLRNGEMQHITAGAHAMFDLGWREATGDFMANDHGDKVHLVATMLERDGAFDGVYAEFFTAGFFLSP